MNIVVTYRVDKDLYDSSEHQVSLVTTEYTYRSDMLVHLQIGKNLGIRMNNRIQFEFQTDKAVRNEQYLFKKTYRKENAKPTTRSTFEDKMKRFDMSQTMTEQEILEECPYTGSDGQHSEVQIVVKVKNGEMIAVIDFKDAEQYKNFVAPAWLIKLDPTT